MTDTCTVLTASQKAQIVAASYKLIDFASYMVKTYPGGQAKRDEQQALDIATDRLLNLLQDL